MSSSLHDKKELFESEVASLSQTNGFLSPISFRYLELMRGKPLVIPNVRKLSLNIALPLAAHVGPLILDGITELSPLVAKSLASHGGTLSLGGLTNLDLQTAQFLMNHEGPLSLNGLGELPPEIATLLARHRGDLHLNGIISLSEPSAFALAEHRGELHLNGLSLIHDRGALALSNHEGKMEARKLLEISMLHPETLESGLCNGLIALLRRFENPTAKNQKSPLAALPNRSVPVEAAPETAHILDQALLMEEKPFETVEDPFVPRFGGW